MAQRYLEKEVVAHRRNCEKTWLREEKQLTEQEAHTVCP